MRPIEIWKLCGLIEGLTPTYKSIANFRKDNCSALKAANRDFLLLCKEPSLFEGEEVAVDGSFFKGDVSKNNIYTKDQLNKQLDYLNEKITAYQEALEQQDATDNKEGKGSLVEDEQINGPHRLDCIGPDPIKQTVSDMFAFE